MTARPARDESGRTRVGGGRPLLWICGPCVIESHDLTLAHRRDARATIADAARPAARLQGVVRQGQPHLGQVVPRRRAGRGAAGPSTPSSGETGLPVTTDVHETPPGRAGRRGVRPAANPGVPGPADRPARGGGRTGRAVNVKKGQFMAPWDMKNVVAKMAEVGNRQRAADRARHDVRLRQAGQRHAGDPVDAGTRLPGDLRRHSQRTEARGTGGPHRRRPGDGPVPGPRGGGRRLRRGVPRDAPRARTGASRRPEHDPARPASPT